MGVSRIFWDTTLFIYLIQDFADLSERVVSPCNRMIERGDEEKGDKSNFKGD
jgi:hypothetical protein